MKYIRYLSYALGEAIPSYGNIGSRLNIVARKAIERGDGCNTYSIGLENHWGTHIDGPAHFFKKGKRISSYKPDYWHFRYPCVINLPSKKGRVIGLSDFDKNIERKSEVLLLKTGFYKLRGMRDYSFDNPVIDPEAAIWLRKKTNIRAIGFDFVSVGSCSNRALGRKSHRAFLNPGGPGRPILIIEDMDLSGSLVSLESLYAVPMLIKDIDSAPCTVLGIFNRSKYKKRKLEG